MPVYDDEEQKTNTGNPGDEELRRLTGIGADEEGAMDREAHSGAAADSAEREGLFNKTGDDPKQVGGARGALGRMRNGRNKLFKSVGKHKWLYGLGAGAIASVVGFIFLIFILLAAFQIPNLAENITAYQFARVFQQAAETNDRVVGEKVAIDAADENIFNKLKAKYDAAGSKVSEKWSKFIILQPNKVLANMDKAGTLKFNYKTTVWGGQKIVGVTMGNTTALVRSKTTAQKLLPAYDFAKGLSSDNISVVQQYQTAMKEGFRAQEVGPITRGLTAKAIRERLGISLTAWNVAKYKNMTEEKARLQEARDAHEKISTPDPVDPKTSTLKDAKEAVQNAEDDTLNSDTKLADVVENKNGVMPDVQKALADSVKPSGFQTALGVINPLYAASVPVCIVYDGSVDNGSSTIDAQSSAQMKEYQYVASAADQQKDGTNASELPVGALNDRLGDSNSSIPLARANDPANTSTAAGTSAEASSGGSFSLLSAIFGTGPVVGVINKIADNTCPTLTNVKVAGVVAAAQIVAAILSGGTEPAVLDGAGNVATRAIAKVAASFAERFGTKAALKETAGKSATIVRDAGSSAIKIASMTVLARMIVASQSGYLTNGVDGGDDLANNADAGGNLMAQSVQREQFYGRPLDASETSQAVNDSLVYVTKQNESKSAYQRYFAMSNPFSLMTRVGMTMSSSAHNFSVANGLSGLSDKLLSPLSTFGNMLMQSNQRLAFAANSPADETYGNVQWGESAEERALSHKPEYGLLENQRVLDASGQEGEIASTYGKCFDGGTTVGTLLSEGDIKRDEQGNVLDDDSTCSPKNLGPHNPHYGDLVFRWRKAQSDDKGIDTLADEQTINDNPSTTGAGAEFNIATFNVLGASHTSGSFQQRADKEIGVITGKGIDVVGVQEMQPQQRDYFMQKLTDYDNFPKGPDSNHNVENSILWKTGPDGFSLVDSGYQPGLVYFCHSNLDAAWVKLKSNKTGAVFYVLNTHDPANAPASNNCSDSAPADRLFNANQHVQYLDKLKQDGLPILFTGDFNSAYFKQPAGSNGSTVGNLDSNVTYCIMTKDKTINDGYDVFLKRQVKCPNPLPNGGGVSGGGIDHIYMTDGITVPELSTVPAQTNGSDHATLIMHVVLPGSDAGSGAGSTFKIASYNIHVHTTPAQNQTVVDNIKNHGFQVVGMQELSYASTFNVFKTKLKAIGYDIYPKQYTGTWDMNSTAITWDTSKFDLVKTDSYTYPAGDHADCPTNKGAYICKRPGAPTTSPVIWLKDKGTGQQIIVTNSHTFAFGITSHFNGPNLRAQAGQALTAKVQSLQSEGLPIFVVGDFNEGYGPSGTAFCMLETKGLMISPFVDNAGQYCKSGGLHGLIDHILTSPKVTGTAETLDAQGSRGYEGVFANLGTDHQHVPYSKVVVPGSGDSASAGGINQASKAGWEWPIAKSDYTGLSECWDAVYNGGHHAGQDIRAGSGTKVYAAHDGTVTWYKYDGSGGNILLINAGGGLWYNYQHLMKSLVKAGQHVSAGQLVAISDNTGGNTTGPHLHFGIAVYAGTGSYADNSQTRNPLNYLPSDRNEAPCG